MADEIAKGVNTLKHLPPIALVGIVVVGVGGVLYIRSRKPAPESDAPETVDSYQPEQVVALERPLIGSLPQPVMGSGSLSSPPEQADVPRRETPIPDTRPIPLTPVAPPRLPVTIGQGLDPVRPRQEPTPQPTPQPTPPQAYTPIQEVKQYPGYPNNFEPNRAMVQDTSGLRSWEELVANERSKGPGWNNTAQQRNLAQIAIGGTARKGVQTKGSAYPPISATNTNRAWTNNVRVSAGLRPLTGLEWNQVQAFMSQMWNGDENASVFQSGQYAKAIFEKYNLPYRYV